MTGIVIFLNLLILQMSRFSITRSYNHNFYLFLTLIFIIINFFYFIPANNIKTKYFKVNKIISIENFFLKNKNIGLFLFVSCIIIFIYYYSINVSYIYQHAFFCERADMLPIINGSLDHMMNFKNPYNYCHCPWEIKNTYLPFILFSYLPAGILKFDIRFISLFSLLMTQLIVFKYYFERGKVLNALLIPLIFFISPLIKFQLIQSQTFPVIFVFSLFFYFFKTENYSAAYFLFGILLGMRRVFIIVFPIIFIFYIKYIRMEKIKYKVIISFLFGVLISFGYALFDPVLFFKNQIEVFSHFSKLQLQNSGNPFLIKSIGALNVVYRILNVKQGILIINILQKSIIIVLYFFSYKNINKKNISLFIFWIIFVFISFTPYTRPEEYYYFLCLVPILFHLTKDKKAITFSFKKTILISGLFISLTLFFPYKLFHKNKRINFDYGFNLRTKRISINSKSPLFSFPVNIIEKNTCKYKFQIRYFNNESNFKIERILINDKNYDFKDLKKLKKVSVLIDSNNLVVGNNRIRIITNNIDKKNIDFHCTLQKK